jgi:hypothetical protein
MNYRLSKRRTGENCLHFDEAAKFYPEEFKQNFESLYVNNKGKNSLAIRPELNF